MWLPCRVSFLWSWLADLGSQVEHGVGEPARAAPDGMSMQGDDDLGGRQADRHRLIAGAREPADKTGIRFRSRHAVELPDTFDPHLLLEEQPAGQLPQRILDPLG